jgi:di/tricarboxylate transporter
MTGDTLLVFGILAATIALFVSDRFRLDLVAVLSLLALALTGVLTPAETLAGFSDPVVVMIAALFVVGGGLFRTGAAERVGTAMGRAAGSSRAGLTAMIMLAAATLSAFLSSTGTVAVMLPMAVALGWNARLSPSLLLIPLAVGSSLGGLLTLVGTPPNLVVSNALVAGGFEPLGFFDFTPVGLAALAVGALVLVPFGGRLLPQRAAVGGGADADVPVVDGSELIQGFGVGPLARLRVLDGSPLVGVSPAGAELRRLYGVSVVDIRRRGPMGHWRRMPGTGTQAFHVGDEVDLQGDAASIARLADEQSFLPLDGPATPDGLLAEVLLTPRSRLIGRTLTDIRFRERYRANVLAVRRRGTPLGEQRRAVTPLRFADTLLVSGAPEQIELLRSEHGDFVVVAQARTETAGGPLTSRQMAAFGVVAAMMVLLALELLPPAIAVLVAAVGMVLTRCLDVEAAYRSINWESVMMIAAMLPMATALDKSGGMAVIVSQLGALGAYGPLALLAGLFVITGVLSQVVSNTATAVLMAPMALQAAVSLGVSPYPLLMTVAVAASSALATPMASPINMLVLGPGAYRFSDFLRTGVIIQVLLLFMTLLVVPLLFPF